jgi:rod shape-determining protein MreD
VTQRTPLFDIMVSPVQLFGALIPMLVALLLVIIANLPISFTGGLLPAPALALAAIYFWVLTRPRLMPPFAVLAIGFAEDLLSGGPPGLWATGFLAAYILIDRQRKTFIELHGAGTLIAFTGAMLLAGGAAYLLASVIYLRFVPLPPLLLESILTVMLYPLLDRPLHWADRSITRLLRSTD